MTGFPTLTPRAAIDQADRIAREAAALRRNLALRKAQSRLRAERAATPAPDATISASPPATR